MQSNKGVLQDWVCELTFMKQSVLIAAIRGPDGTVKMTSAKMLVRWLRRCVLYSAFDKCVLMRPYDAGELRGGSFTGPSLDCVGAFQGEKEWFDRMIILLEEYLDDCDGLPHHYQLHFMYAAEILGYEHPDDQIKKWWSLAYKILANDMHLNPETKEAMDKRLGDNEQFWRAAEEVTAKPPKEIYSND